MGIIGAVKRAYRAVVPASLQRFVRESDSASARHGRRAREWLKSLRSDSDLYDADYFATEIEPGASAFAPMMAEALIREFNPSSVVDVGCGTGALLAAFAAHGVRCVGLENAPAALAWLDRRGLAAVRFDLESAAPFPGIRADLAVTVEVAEHLPESAAGRFVSLLCSVSDTVVFTAARPGQGGTDHVNEQPSEYWVARFGSLGFQLRTELTENTRGEWGRRGLPAAFCGNLLIFARGEGRSLR